MAKLKLAIIGSLTSLSAAQSTHLNYSEYVNVFLGTTDGGNMFPGVVAAPNAMTKLGPDVENGTVDAYSGYLPEGRIYGFSMMHESGTGGAPKYGVVSQMPATGVVSNPLQNLSQSRSADDVAGLGYYKSTLANGIAIEVAATDHAGLYQYSFPHGENSVVVDVSHVLPSFRGLGWGQGYSGGGFRLSANGSYTGSGIYNNGWNLSLDWMIYFCGHFDQPPTSQKVFTGNGTILSSYGNLTATNGTYRQGGVFTFNQQKVTSRVGISFISASKACKNVESEIPRNSSLRSLVTQAQSRWAAEVFSKGQVTESNRTVLTQLYSYLYGMNLLPTNRTGENPGWESDEPSYDDFFTMWDVFRCSTPLWQIVQPSTYEEIIRSLVNVWRHDGFLPDGRSSNFNGRTQGGSNADNVLADAYVKGVRGAVNWEDAYKAMKTDAETTPPNNNDPIAPEASTKEGRGALPDWIEYGYITPNFTRAVSRAVEYSVNDFSLTQVARGLGYTEDYNKYLTRSRNWRNHWNPNQASLNFTGFLVPRYANGSFEEPYDPLQCGGCYWGDPYYQDTPWSYSLNAQHDIAQLIDLAGGDEEFVARLEKFFEEGVYDGNEAFGNTLFNPGNQPAFNTPYLFSFAGRQDLSVKYSRRAALAFYGAGEDGIPGNSDAGAMQTWILWNMIGLYPITGQTTFLVGSPFFEELKLDLGGNRKLVVTATGGDRYVEPYVQSLRVNGVAWTKGWAGWEDVFEEGGRLDFVLGKEGRRWDSLGERPPSPASFGRGM